MPRGVKGTKKEEERVKKEARECFFFTDNTSLINNGVEKAWIYDNPAEGQRVRVYREKDSTNKNFNIVKWGDNAGFEKMEVSCYAIAKLDDEIQYLKSRLESAEKVMQQLIEQN